MENKAEEMKKDIHTVLLHNCKYDYCEGVLVGFNEEGIARELYDEGYRKQEWISVEERLPSEDVRVLVWLRKDHKTTYTRIDTDRRLNGAWVRWYESATHWMPLPSAPK
jgi:hypothetical protein